jgi:hypothetical protein
LIALLFVGLLAQAALLSPVGIGAPKPSGKSDPPQVLVVLDVSGSMSKPAGNGKTRLQAARDALAQLVAGLPRDSLVGVRVYGSEYTGKAQSHAACTDSRLLVPLDTNDDPRRILDPVDALKPTGWTPIAQALKYASSDLAAAPGDGPKHIVLISDGQATCTKAGVPVCSVVSTIRQTGVNVRIETIGIALEGQGAEALRCLARTSGGKYYAASDTDALSAALERIGSDVLGELGAGKPTKGGNSPRSAVKVKPGAYRLTLRPGQDAWFAFDGPEKSDPHVLASIEGLRSLSVPRENRKCRSWQVQLINPYGEGGTYAPYGNSGLFVGVGMGATGASTTHPLNPYTKGIDFPGSWKLRLALGQDSTGAISECARSLPPNHPFPVRFSLQLSAPGKKDQTAASATASASPTATQTQAATQAADPAEKYNRSADPNASPTWMPAAIATGLTLAAGGLGWLIFRIIRRRRRGW